MSISAPTPLAAHTWPRSASKPSDTSMHAFAKARNASPAATRGSGRFNLARNATSGGFRSPVPGPRLRNKRNAPTASPKVPVTNIASPAHAPARGNDSPIGSVPSAVTVTDNGPCVVSPPTNATPCARASSANPSAKRSTKRASAVGRVKASKAHAGSAPIAARSDKFTASDFHPRSPGAVPGRKCTPSTMVSVQATSRCPAGTSSNAASSPTPSTTSGRTPCVRTRMVSIRSNSMA